MVLFNIVITSIYWYQPYTPPPTSGSVIYCSIPCTFQHFLISPSISRITRDDLFSVNLLSVFLTSIVSRLWSRIHLWPPVLSSLKSLRHIADFGDEIFFKRSYIGFFLLSPKSYVWWHNIASPLRHSVTHVECCKMSLYKIYRLVAKNSTKWQTCVAKLIKLRMQIKWGMNLEISLLWHSF